VGQQGIWSNYVETHLLPRLNGFELLMASYAMAHLKLDLLLSETGYKPTTPAYGHPSKGGEFARQGGQFLSKGGEFARQGGQFPSTGGVPEGRGGRLRVYLTNSLEESHPDTGTLFANWLSTEANEANHIKRDTPVMVVMGNPPYSVSSTNKSEWIEKLTADYKKDLNEKNIQPLSDDYIKFIRFGQHYIDKNGSGILAYISNNSFIDGIIHRQMRKNLLESFDSIYILDLHGNAKKKEICLDGSADQNVFDIMQGVSINIFVKTGKKKNELCKVFHYELKGKREPKYAFLNENSIQNILWNNLNPNSPNFFLVKKDFNVQDSYDNGFSLHALFTICASGITTERDHLTIQFEKNKLDEIKSEISRMDENSFRIKYTPKPDGRDWKISFAKNDLEKNKGAVTDILYRPFDLRKTIYTGKSKGFMAYPRHEISFHLFKKNNLAFLCLRQSRDSNSNCYFITKEIFGKDALSSLDRGTGFPLYLYPETNAQQTIGQSSERTPNLNPAIVQQIAEALGIKFVPEKNSPSSPEVNSPPLEGCPKGGVDNIDSTNTIGGVVDRQPINPKGGVVNMPATNPKCTVFINNIPIKRNFVENLPHNPAMNQRAKDKRKAGILSEVLFWQQVHKGVFHNIDFDRQRIIGNYIVDFYVKTLGLIIEIDGSSHDEKVEYDAKRQLFLEGLGLRVYRIQDFDVKNNLDNVMQALENYIVMEYGDTTGAFECGGKATPPFGHPSKGGEGAPAEGNISKGGEGEFAPIDLLDYIYAVLHSPTYREKYKEFLKIDFPRVPYPKNGDVFWQLVKLGGELRQIHLLESPVVDQYITQYPIDGDNGVDKIRFELSVIGIGRVYINETQYFGNVPEVAWNFYIGGYQPAQKWLKDRKGRKLEFEDILHYQKIIVALSETARIMAEIDKIAIE